MGRVAKEIECTVIKAFIDKYTKVLNNIGDVVKYDKKRAEELINKGYLKR